MASLLIATQGAAEQPQPPPESASAPAEDSEPATKQVSDDAEAPPPQDAAIVTDERWTSFLPLLADEAKAAGYELPLPLGISINHIYLSRDVDVNSIKVSLNDGEFQSVDGFLDVGANSTVNAVVARFDAFILPFLNVYFLTGWLTNDSNVKLNISIPLPGPSPPRQIQLRDSGTLEGWTYGGGTTLSGGYKNWFAALDANFAYAEFDEFDSNLTAIVASLRTGWHGRLDRRLGGGAARFWVGGTYWDTERDVKGSIMLPGGDRLRYKVEQGPENPWNMNFGTNVQLYGPVEFTFDLGTNYDDMISVTSALSYRF